MQNSNLPPLPSSPLPLPSPSSSRQNGRWTPQQHQKFIQGVKLFGKNWKKIQEVVKTRNGSQIRSHAQKYFNKYSSEDSGSIRKMSETQEYYGNNLKQEVGSIDYKGDWGWSALGLTGGLVFTPEEYENMFVPPLDPSVFLSRPLGEVQRKENQEVEGEGKMRPRMPHQIWKESGEILLKRSFIETFVEYEVPDKENKREIGYERKSSFTRCECQ